MRIFGFTGGHSGSYVPSVPAGDPYDVIHAWVGAVTTTGATVKFRSTNASAAVLLVSTSPTLTSPTTFTATEGADDVWTATVTGLSANTQYYYGFDEASLTGKFRTFLSGAGTFTIALASCSDDQEYDGPGRTSNSPAFDRITDRDPLLFMHMGDRGYPDPGSNNPSLFRTNYNNNMGNARQKAMHLAMPVAYTWDDHDYGGNDSNGTDVAKPAAQQVYREHVPHWTLPSGSLIYQSFAISPQVRVIMLDTRSERSPHSATDNSSKTMLGATQKAWLKDELLAATEACIVVDTVSPWIGTSGLTWGIYSTERAEFAEFFEDNNLTDRLILVSGDAHWLSGDDGTNSQFDTGSANPGPIVTSLGPLDNSFETSSGTWSEGIHKVSQQQYGTMDFDDDGSSVDVILKGWSVEDLVETEEFSLSRTF